MWSYVSKPCVISRKWSVKTCGFKCLSGMQSCQWHPEHHISIGEHRDVDSKFRITSICVVPSAPSPSAPEHSVAPQSPVHYVSAMLAQASSPPCSIWSRPLQGGRTSHQTANGVQVCFPMLLAGQAFSACWGGVYFSATTISHVIVFVILSCLSGKRVCIIRLPFTKMTCLSS